MGAVKRWRSSVPFGCFAVLRVIASVRPPSLFHDSPSYDQLSFLGHQPRLWTVPLVYTLTSTNTLREAVQILAGIFAWSFLATSTAGLVRNPTLRHVARVLVLLVGLLPAIALWDGAMLSESLAISLTVVLVGLVIRLRRPTPGLLAATLCITLLWAFTRQTNMVTLLVIYPCLVALAFRCRSIRGVAAVTVALTAVVAWGAYTIFVAEQSYPANHVWRFNALELITDRIAFEPQALHYFVSHGMPLAPVVVAERTAVPSLRLAEDVRFGSWVDHSFQRLYLGWLETHLSSAVSGSLRTAEQSLLGRPAQYGNARSVLPVWLTAVLWPTTGAGVAAWLFCALTLVVVGIITHRKMTGWFACGIFVVVATIMAADTYLFATEEYPRLLMPTALLLRLVLLFAVILATDALVDGAPGERRLVRPRRRALAPTGRPHGASTRVSQTRPVTLVCRPEG